MPNLVIIIRIVNAVEGRRPCIGIKGTVADIIFAHRIIWADYCRSIKATNYDPNICKKFVYIVTIQRRSKFEYPRQCFYIGDLA